MNQRLHHPGHRRGGFTLAEILIAMAVFLIGFIAVVSLFPAAAILQKQTVDDVRTTQVARTVEAMMKAQPYRELDATGPDVSTPNELVDGDPTGTDADVVLRFLPDPSPANNGYPIGNWTFADRSLPLLTPDPTLADYFWVPMIRYDSASGVWSVYAFIMQRVTSVDDYRLTAGPNGANPDDPIMVPYVRRHSGVAKGAANEFTGVNNADDRLRPGDWILDDNGVVYQITKTTATTIELNSFIPESPVSPTRFWYVPPGVGGNRSPLVRIIQIVGTDAVQP